MRGLGGMLLETAFYAKAQFYDFYASSIVAQIELAACLSNTSTFFYVSNKLHRLILGHFNVIYHSFVHRVPYSVHIFQYRLAEASIGKSFGFWGALGSACFVHQRTLFAELILLWIWVVNLRLGWGTTSRCLTSWTCFNITSTTLFFGTLFRLWLKAIISHFEALKGISYFSD